MQNQQCEQCQQYHNFIVNTNGTGTLVCYHGPVPISGFIPAGEFADFFALMPGDNSATIAVGAPVLFPQSGPTVGGITRVSAGVFNIPTIGSYKVSWQVSVNEPGQLMLQLGTAILPDTVVGRATGTSQIVGICVITTTVINSTLSVINPPGNSTALTVTPVAGGTHSVSAHLVIERLL